MESALYGVYTLVVLYQKSHSFASLTCSISDTAQLLLWVCGAPSLVDLHVLVYYLVLFELTIYD